MKIKIFLAAALIFISQITFPAFSANEQPKSIIVSYKSTEKGVKDEIYRQSIYSGEKIKTIGDDIEAFDFSDTAEAARVMKRLKRDSRVACVEYNYPKYLMGVAPDDPHFNSQWSHDFADAVTGWEVTALTEQREIVVAVIDTGAKTDHEDLIGRLTNPYNAVIGGDDVTDNSGHGTFVSGIIAATANNGTGVAGVAGEFNIKVMPIKVANSKGKIDGAAYLNGIQHAISENVDVINISLGSKNYSETEEGLITQAVENGIVVLAATGNINPDYGMELTDLIYPAAYNTCISVASHDEYGVKSDFSIANPSVDITAPGSSIKSTYINAEGYAVGDGTSFSSPYAAGIAAMIKASAPSKTPNQIRGILTQTAVSPPGQSGRTDEYGYGYVNVAAALRAVYDFDYNAEIWLNQDTVHLTQDVENLTLTAQTDGPNAVFIWYEDTDNSVTIVDRAEYIISKGGGTGNNAVTAKIPLGTNEAVCRYSWDSSTAPNNLSETVFEPNIQNGTLMSGFYLTKADYFINAHNEKIPKINSIGASAGVFYKIKNSDSLNGESIVTVSVPGDSRTFTFVPKQFNEGLYPYFAEDDGSVIFAVTAYKNTAGSYIAQMVRAFYEGAKLVDLLSEPIEIKIGYTIKEIRTTVLEGQNIKVLFIDNFESLTPFCEPLPYEPMTTF